MKTLDNYISNIFFASGLGFMSPSSMIVLDAIKGADVSGTFYYIAFYGFGLGVATLMMGAFYLRYQQEKNLITSSQVQTALRQLIHYAE